MNAATASVICLGIAVSIVGGHMPTFQGVGCGPHYGSFASAYDLGPIGREEFGYNVVTCDSPALWIKFEVPAVYNDTMLYFSGGSLSTKRLDNWAGNPVNLTGDIESLDRFSQLRIDALVLGPELPMLNQSLVPSHIKFPSEYTSGVLLEGVRNLSTCDHVEHYSEWDAKVEDGVCSIYDGDAAAWQTLVIDRIVRPTVAGTYYVAFFLQSYSVGKLWWSFGDLGKNVYLFRNDPDYRPKPIPKVQCDCGDQRDFHEQLSSTLPVPSATMCVNASFPPREAYCMGDPGNEFCYDTIHAVSSPVQDCDVAMRLSPCGTSMWGVDVDDVCKRSCGHCGMNHTMNMSDHGEHEINMGCGNINSCNSSQLYVEANQRMHQGMAVHFECDPLLDFVRSMIPHHHGAVQMCDVLLANQKPVDPSLLHFCKHVKAEQGRETAGMLTWLLVYGYTAGLPCGDGSMGCGNMSCPSSRAYMHTNHAMHHGMAINFSCDSEVDFVQSMIPHHQGAIDMCDILVKEDAQTLKAGYRGTYLMELCSNITRIQRAEIMWMADWLTQRGLPFGATCEGTSYPSQYPCDDMLLLSDSCHSLGGDWNCRCENITKGQQCSKLDTDGLNVSHLCQRSCGLCPVRKDCDGGHDGHDHNGHTPNGSDNHNHGDENNHSDGGQHGQEKDGNHGKGSCTENCNMLSIGQRSSLRHVTALMLVAIAFAIFHDA